ncbi:MAG: hypothetical protein L3J36_09305 [Rhodobacteraceae bacterium]|nr:hypothetical protein [Paracoccaceae bacterium]
MARNQILRYTICSHSCEFNRVLFCRDQQRARNPSNISKGPEVLKFDIHQFSTFADAFSNDFVQDTIAFLREKRPTWAAEQSEAQIDEHVQHTVKFAKAHNIKTVASFQKLALMKIDLAFDDDPGSYARMLLRANRWSEERRIVNFDAARRLDPSLKRVRFRR